jgi:hypothetical protein
MPITLSNLAADLIARLNSGPMDQDPGAFVLPAGQRPVGTTGTGLTASRAVFVYMGRARRNWTPQAISFLCRTAPTGTGQTEVWMGTSPNAPTRGTAQTLTRTWSQLTTTIHVTNALTRFTTSVPQIAVGSHLWLGVRAATWTGMPSLEASSYSLGSGVLYWVGSTGLTLSGAASISSGSLTQPAATDLTPTLRLEI